MSQPRMNLYGFPHKAIRSSLSIATFTAGSIDYANEDSLKELKLLTDELVSMLQLHAKAEDDVMLADLEAKAPGSTAENMAEHEELEKMIEAFHEELKGIGSDSSPMALYDFYMNLNRFYSRYLEHMEMEERQINPLLWEHFSDEEIQGMQGRILGTFTPEESLMWNKYIVPAITPFERTIMLGAVKQNAPPEFFDAVVRMLRDYMPSHQIDQVLNVINNPAKQES